ncbi:uncharacterized protein LOC126746630 [Anthonomus grandis grandis]|uniref:uncharacterized protein LOC126746630 n=1 Tax=Anthonomus grandis grandis TaxID=2921223 RepID=UPI002165B38F|nr:uncharacterized protein LOC126746630 [Anthonomus grandis grandis]
MGSNTKTIDLYIATNLEDLTKIASPDKLGKNPKILEKVIKNLYSEICRETTDDEKCFIYCHRYLVTIQILCKIADAKYIRALYFREISRVNNRIEELRAVLEQRYKEAEQLRKISSSIDNLKTKTKLSTEKLKLEKVSKHLFPTEFITVKELYQAIQENSNILIIDIRPSNEFGESKIKFENLINIPDDIIVAGLSANMLGQKLKDDTQKIWDKRDTFDALVFLDWNSGSDNITCNKLNYLKDSVVEWDCNRKYKQHPVIVNGGFKEFLDSYPGSVTNVHVNFIRNNEDIDELLELDSIIYPEPDQNVSIMPLKQFTIEELEESTKIDEQCDEGIESDIGSQGGEIPTEAPSIPPVEYNYEDIEEGIPPHLPKGGAIIDKSADIKEDDKAEKDADTNDIKNKIEEQRLRLLMEARNRKNEKSSMNIKNLVEEIGDKPGYTIKKAPPPIRRETKPQKVDVRFGGWCGLVNIRNTCYMNTILQCLKCIPIIRMIVHSYYDKYVTRRPPLIINEFVSVIQNLCQGTENDKKVFKPSAFYDVVCRLDPVYKKGNHEDCMEFFLFLFNHLNDDCGTDIKKKSVMIEREKAWYSQLQGRTSFWVDLFYHQFRNTKICQMCRAKADSYETDNTLMLPVPYRPGLRSVNLRDLINEYLEDNQILDYKCSKCQNLGVINTKEVVVAPEILVLVLKRYYQDEYQETRKNNICVNFDLNFKFGNCSYRLYSVAEHRGTMEHGHYFAHGVINDSTWVEFNDDRTMRFSGDWDSIRGSACAFFYCKDTKRNP